MKYFAFLSMALGMLFSCKSDKIEQDPSVKVIKYQESISLRNGTLKFTEVNDSRCPSDPGIFCITGGAAIVDLELRSAQDISLRKQVRMCLGECGYLINGERFSIEDTIIISLANINYSLILFEVNPYPKFSPPQSEKDKKDYTIKLKLEQK